MALLAIDDFKGVNAKPTETHVDREVLPRLMLLLEACTSQCGCAVRQAGDEYILVYSNATTDEVGRTLQTIRTAVPAAFSSAP